MSEARFTPGPWSVYEDGLIIIAADGFSLGEMTPGAPDISEDEAFANARLTAAAPALYDHVVTLKELFRFALLSTTPEIAKEGMEFIRAAEKTLSLSGIEK